MEDGKLKEVSAGTPPANQKEKPGSQPELNAQDIAQNPGQVTASERPGWTKVWK